MQHGPLERLENALPNRLSLWIPPRDIPSIRVGKSKERVDDIPKPEAQKRGEDKEKGGKKDRRKEGKKERMKTRSTYLSSSPRKRTAKSKRRHLN